MLVSQWLEQERERAWNGAARVLYRGLGCLFPDVYSSMRVYELIQATYSVATSVSADSRATITRMVLSAVVT